MNIYVLIAIVMTMAPLFLVGALASPYKSILLPVNIPIECNFQYHGQLTDLGNPSILNGSSPPYEIVVLGIDNSELLRLKPEEARNLLHFEASELGGTALLHWGSTPNSYQFKGETGQEMKALRVTISPIVARNGGEPFTLQVPASDNGFVGEIEMDKDGKNIISFKEFDWTFSGDSIALPGGRSQTGRWSLETSGEAPLQTINDPNQVTVKSISLFSSPNLYVEDSLGQKFPVPLEAIMTGTMRPSPAELGSYVQSQINLQVFGWLAPVAALMVIFWLDSRYRRKIKLVVKPDKSGEPLVVNR